MTAAKIERYLTRLQVTKIRRRDAGPEIKITCACPLARWTHSKGSDDHPSFVVFAKEQGESTCACKSCGFHGYFRHLLQIIRKNVKKDSRSVRDVDRLLNDLSYDEERSEARPRLDRGNDGLYSMPSKDDSIAKLYNMGVDYGNILELVGKNPALDESVLRTVSEMEAFLWNRDVAEEDGIDPLLYVMQERGLSEDTIRRYRLGWHPTTRRIAIPQFDLNGRLVNIGGRYIPSAMDRWEPPRWMHSFGFKKELYLFGEDRLNPSTKNETGFLVEGMFDQIYLTVKGLPNVLAMLGSDLSRYQQAKICGWFSTLVIIPDGDRPGKTAADKIEKYLDGRIKVHVFDTPTGLDPDQLPDDLIEQIRSKYLSH